jgi:hypothetical protein
MIDVKSKKRKTRHFLFSLFLSALNICNNILRSRLLHTTTGVRLFQPW